MAYGGPGETWHKLPCPLTGISGNCCSPWQINGIAARHIEATPCHTLAWYQRSNGAQSKGKGVLKGLNSHRRLLGASKVNGLCTKFSSYLTVCRHVGSHCILLTNKSSQPICNVAALWVGGWSLEEAISPPVTRSAEISDLFNDFI